MALDRRGDVISRVERRAVQGFDQADLVFADHRRLIKAYEEQSELALLPAFERHRIGENAVGAGREDFDLRPFVAAGADEQLGVLKVAVALDRLAEQPASIERRAVGSRDDADLALRDDSRFGDRDAEQVRVNRPQARRQCAQLDAFDAALFNKGNRVLKVVVRILRPVRRENSTGRVRLAVNGFDDAHLVRADLDQRHSAHDLLERPLDQVQAGLEHIGLNADLAFGSDDATGRHSPAEVAALLDGDLELSGVELEDSGARADVDEDAPQDGQQDDEGDDTEDDPGQKVCVNFHNRTSQAGKVFMCFQLLCGSCRRQLAARFRQSLFQSEAVAAALRLGAEHPKLAFKQREQFVRRKAGEPAFLECLDGQIHRPAIGPGIIGEPGDVQHVNR